MYSLVIFDLDGTLFKSEEIEHELALEISNKQNLGITTQFLNERIGTDSKSVREAFVNLLGSEECFERFEEELTENKNKFLEKNGLPWKDGALEILNFLKENGINIALATSTKRNLLNQYEALGKFYDFFNTTIAGDEVVNPKPGSECFITVMKRLNSLATETLIIEDSPSGTLAAINSKAKVIWIKDIVNIPNNLLNDVFVEEHLKSIEKYIL